MFIHADTSKNSTRPTIFVVGRGSYRNNIMYDRFVNCDNFGGAVCKHSIRVYRKCVCLSSKRIKTQRRAMRNVYQNPMQNVQAHVRRGASRFVTYRRISEIDANNQHAVVNNIICYCNTR